MSPSISRLEYQVQCLRESLALERDINAGIILEKESALKGMMKWQLSYQSFVKSHDEYKKQASIVPFLKQQIKKLRERLSVKEDV